MLRNRTIADMTTVVLSLLMCLGCSKPSNEIIRHGSNHEEDPAKDDHSSLSRNQQRKQDDQQARKSPSNQDNTSTKAFPNHTNLTSLFPNEETWQSQLNRIDDKGAHTYIGSRVRLRHARSAKSNGDFGTYTVFPKQYFLKRSYAFKVLDKTALGIPELTINLTTIHGIVQRRNFKSSVSFFYSGREKIFNYHLTGYLEEVFQANPDEFPRPSEAPPPGSQFHHYTYTLKGDAASQWLIKGKPMEMEFAFIMDPVDDGGADWYYSSVWLFTLGQPGAIPWHAPGRTPGGAPSQEKSQALPNKVLSGGMNTLSEHLSGNEQLRFGQMSPNLSPSKAQDFLEGRRLFHTNFSTGQHTEGGHAAFTEMTNKAGPHFNKLSCSGCHTNNGGGLPIQENQPIHHFVFKTMTPNDQVKVGAQVRTNGPNKSTVTARFESQNINGNQLRRPVFSFQPPLSTKFSARRPLRLVAMGLIEAIDESSILENENINGNPISGRASIVKDLKSGDIRLGRFGWKAERSSLRDQVATALSLDMDVGSPIVPDSLGNIEVNDNELQKIVAYLRGLGTPPRRGLTKNHNQAAKINEGEVIFQNIGCQGCHIKEFKTGEKHPVPELRNQIVRLYSDLLLHDMGPDLASTSTLGSESASESEWRTPPLIGIGMTAIIGNGQESYLHDGRARSLKEAILWHGGEAAAIKNKFSELSDQEQNLLITFLKSL